jgi:hypothetical protein
MAAYFLRCEHVSRATGARVTRAAAYRAGERVRDERTSEVYDYSDRDDVAYKEVVLPADLAGRDDVAWAQDRSTLWNAAEHAGRRCNSRLARDWIVLLPTELNARQRAQLVRGFASELAEKYRCAVDVCVHLPRPGADSRNHAHLLMTTREVSSGGLGRRTTLELAGSERRQLGIEGSSKAEYLAIRARWAELTNEAFRQAGLQVRIDHRSYKDQGIDREPTARIPPKVFYAERQAQGVTAAGDEIRARHRERVEARSKGSAELSRVLRSQQARLKENARQHFQRENAQPKGVRWGALTREERNAVRRERYRALREKEKADPVAEAKRRAMRQAEHERRKQRNPEALKEAGRRWRRENPDAAKAISQRYRDAHREEQNRNKRDKRRARAQQLATARSEFPTPGRVQEQPKSVSITAEESARRWQEYRQTHGPGPTAEESARAWAAMREREKASGVSEANSHSPHAQDRESKSRDDDDDTDRKRRRQHDHDFEM